MHIALTGGIGSGKSFVCKLLAERGVKVYDCDSAAKRLMLSDVNLQCELSNAAGRNVFPDGMLDKEAMRQFLLASEENTEKVNSIVHPAVAIDYVNSGCEWLESAILFESGFVSRVHFNYIICVTAPLETRIERIISRDNVDRETALAWIGNQMAQEEKMGKSDFVIMNDGRQEVGPQLDRLLARIDNINNKLKI